jgi:murein DD-endopeptidase MepM/ murein hydrolase activator NlpD
LARSNLSFYKSTGSARRRGRLLSVAFHLLLGGAAAGFLPGLGILHRQSRTLDRLTAGGRLEAQSRSLDVERASLDRSLEDLIEHLLETGYLAGEARDRLGLPSSRPLQDVLDPLDAGDRDRPSPPQVEESLRQARSLRSSFAEIVAAMEANADAWEAVPSAQPLHEALLTSGFGLRRDPFNGRLAWHQGIDLCARTGEAICATGAGRVVRSGPAGDFGLLVEIDHGNGLHTLYGHTSRTAVQVGEWVERGDTVAFVGMTGRASAPHLHYEIHVNGEAVNPEPYLLPGLWVAD